MIRYVAMFDRDLARALVVASRSWRARAEAGEPNEVQGEFDAWTLLDPSGAIAAVEKLPIDPDQLLLSTLPEWPSRQH